MGDSVLEAWVPGARAGLSHNHMVLVHGAELVKLDVPVCHVAELVQWDLTSFGHGLGFCILNHSLRAIGAAGPRATLGV